MGKVEKCTKKKRYLQDQTNKLLAAQKNKPPPTPRDINHTNTDNNVNLREQLQILQKKFDELVQKMPEPECRAVYVPTNFEFQDTRSDTQAANDGQLYGQNYENEEMVLLRDNIFCKKIIFDSATCSSFKASHLARSLIEGVFKIEAILECTLSGQSPKAQGEERRTKNYKALNGQARKAIIDFSTEHAEKRGWPPQSHFELNRSMTQKIGEIKRQYKKNV